MTNRVDDDEIHVIKGAPGRRTNYSALSVFGVLALLVIAIVLIFSSLITQVNRGINGLVSAALGGIVLATLAALVESWLFRRDIRPGSRVIFVLAASGGGFLGGLVSGAIVRGGDALSGLLAGAIMGGVAGAVSSLGQIQLMPKRALAGRWFGYSLISWAIIWSIGWAGSWALQSAVGTALGAGIVMAGTGLSVWLLFLNSNIEF